MRNLLFLFTVFFFFYGFVSLGLRKTSYPLYKRLSQSSNQSNTSQCQDIWNNYIMGYACCNLVIWV